MLHPIRSLHQFLDKTPPDSAFFRRVVFVPVIGVALKIWKRAILYQEVAAIRLQDVDIRSDEGVVRYNRSLGKMVQIHNFGTFSFGSSRLADLAFICSGFFLNRVSPVLGLTTAVLGCSSVFARNFVYLKNLSMLRDLEGKVPRSGDGWDERYDRLLVTGP
jgi:hypothetical protein